MIYSVFIAANYGKLTSTDYSLLGLKETIQSQLLCVEPTYYQSL